MKGLGFKNTLITTVILMLLIALGLTSYIALNHLKDTTTKDFETTIFNSLEYEAQNIQEYVYYRSQPVAELANMLKDNEYKMGDEKYLSFAAAATPVTKFTIGYEDGRSYASRASASFPEGVGIKERYDPRTRPWYQLGKSVKDLTISDVFFTSSTHEPLVAVVHPIKNGVLAGDLRLSHLSNMLQDVKTIEGSVAFIMDKKGLILASTADYILMGDQLQDTADLSSISKTILNNKNLIDELTINKVEKIDEQLEETKTTKVDNILFSNRFELIDGSQWYIVMLVEKDIALASVASANLKLTILAIVIAVVSALLLFAVLYRIYQPVVVLRKMVVGLSRGDADLTQRLDVKTDDDLGQIAQGINNFIEMLQQMMIEILNSSANISQEIEQLKKVSSSNEQALVSHASETEQVVTAITEMSASANAVAENAKQTADNTKQASDEALASKDLVTASSESVRALVNEVDSASARINTMNDNTQEIVSVLSVIGAIAEQTNLLALNAAIEAARAGEQGRGFAVVADEVRSLAARTQSSTAEINELLSKLTNDASLAVEAMETTKESCQVTTDNTIRVGTGLDTMAGSIIEINELSTHIANASLEQSGVAEEINRNMASIQEMVHNLTDNGALTTNSTESLLAANNQLVKIVSSFKLK